MKKLLAVFVSLMLMILPMAVAEQPDLGAAASAIPSMALTLTIPGQADYTLAWGSDAEGDFIITLTGIDGVENLGIQVGADILYITGNDKVYSLTYEEAMALAQNANPQTSTSIDAPVLELLTTLGNDLAPMVTMQTTETSFYWGVNISFDQFWTACGNDIAAWATANTDYLNAKLKEQGQTDVDVSEYIPYLGMLGMMGIDCSQKIEVSADWSTAFPVVNVALDTAYAGESVFSACFYTTEDASIGLTAAAEGLNIDLLAKMTAANEYTLYSGDATVATLRWDAIDTQFERLTDGTGAVSLIEAIAAAQK